MKREHLIVMIADDHGEEHRYEIGLLRAGPALRLGRRLMKVATPLTRALRGVISAVGRTNATLGASGASSYDVALSKLGENLDLDEVDVEGTLHAFVDGLAAEGEVELLKEILSCVQVRTSSLGTPQSTRTQPSRDFDAIYTGNLGEMVVAAYHCLVHNYSDAVKRFASGNGFSAK